MKYSQYARFLLETALIKAALSGRLLDISGRTVSTRESGSAHSVPGSRGGSASSPPRITGLTPYEVMGEKESKSFEKQAVSGKKDNRIQEIIHLIAGKRKSLEMQLRSSEKLEINDNKLIIYLSHYARKHTRETLEKNKENRQILQDACRQVLGNGADYVIRDFIPNNLEAAEEEEGRFKGRNKFEVEKIKGEPTVQKLIDTFGGEITEYEDIRHKPMED
jgi:hypothetical protein